MIKAVQNLPSELWTRIEAFNIDGDDNVAFPFDVRLAQENGWSRDFARRVVDEYKRFVFLAMTAGHPVTPSDQVDQAWHLHLTYTRSYWQRLCGEVLPRPLHHDPTKGGDAEEHKFDDWYARTKESYLWSAAADGYLAAGGRAVRRRPAPEADQHAAKLCDSQARREGFASCRGSRVRSVGALCGVRAAGACDGRSRSGRCCDCDRRAPGRGAAGLYHGRQASHHEPVVLRRRLRRRILLWRRLRRRPLRQAR